MVNQKISLTFVIPGRTMVSSPEDCEQNPQENQKSHKKGKVRKHRRPNKSYRVINATQHINMSLEAYNYMLSTPATPKLGKVVRMVRGKAIRPWDTMSEDEKLRAYFDLLAHDLKAKSYTYELIND